MEIKRRGFLAMLPALAFLPKILFSSNKKADIALDSIQKSDETVEIHYVDPIEVDEYFYRNDNFILRCSKMTLEEIRHKYGVKDWERAKEFKKLTKIFDIDDVGFPIL